MSDLRLEEERAESSPNGKSPAQHPAGIVYTETVVFAPPQQYVSEAPYQIAILDLDDGARVTARILARGPEDRIGIGDCVVYAQARDGVLYYRRKS
jgi:uncharacterized OB-fold protein